MEKHFKIWWEFIVWEYAEANSRSHWIIDFDGAQIDYEAFVITVADVNESRILDICWILSEGWRVLKIWFIKNCALYDMKKKGKASNCLPFTQSLEWRADGMFQTGYYDVENFDTTEQKIF